MPRQVRTNLDFLNASKLVNVPQASASGEVVTYEQMLTAIEGISWKSSVRAASTANINLSSPGTTIDAITMTNGDRFLAKDQTTASQNGIYIFNGAASAATRALDASTFEELEGAVVTVQEGTSNQGSRFRQTAVNGVIDTDAITWVSDNASVPSATETIAGVAEVATQAETDAGVADNVFITPLKLANWSGRVQKAFATIGDGAATSFVLTHNFGTTDILVNVFLASTGEEIICDIVRNSSTQVTLSGFTSAPALNSLRVVAFG